MNISFSFDSLDKISNIIDKTIYLFPSPQNFAESNGEYYINIIKSFSEKFTPQQLYQKLSTRAEDLMSECPRFLFFPCKLSKSKKATTKLCLISNPPILTTFDPVDPSKNTASKLPINTVCKKNKSSIIFQFIDGSTTKLFFDYESFGLCDLLLRFFTGKEKPFVLFLECLKFLGKFEIPTHCEPFMNLVLKMFTETDYFPIRHLYNLHIEVASKRLLSTYLVKIHGFQQSLCFYLNYITAMYFLNPPQPQELLRGDSLLTNSLGAVRDVYAPNFYRFLTDYLVSETKQFSSTEDVLNSFLNLMKTFPIPGILRWICWMIFHEAQRAFPEGDGPFYAVSSFFFLRGLGPILAQVDDPVARKKCISITGLINFSQKPEYQKFIPKFKQLIQEISLDVKDSNLVQKLPDEELCNAVIGVTYLLKDFLPQIEGVIKTNVDPPGQHPIVWFLERQYEVARKYKN